MKKIIVVVGVFIFFFTTLAFAQNFSIKAEVDKTSIATDEIMTYKIIITSSDKKITPPQIPKFERFKVTSQAESSSMSFGKGAVKVVLVYTFILAPTSIGKFKIEPATIKVKNQTYSTDTFEIEVTQGEAKPKVKPEEKSIQPEIPQPETEPPQTTL